MPRTRLAIAVGVLLAGIGAARLGAQAMGPRQLEVTFNDGKVSIVAQNVTVRDILMEWGRKGGSRMINVEKLGGAIIPIIEFHDEPEAKVLRSLLRDVPGYGAAPRVAPAPTASSFAAVFVLPTRTVAVSGVSAASPGPVQQVQQAPQPQAVPQPIQGSVDDEIPPVRQVGELPPSTPGNPANTNPNLRTGPGGAVTSTVPGVIIPGNPTPPAGGGTAGPGGTGPRPAGGRGGGGGGR
ncbi:MAG: hypothetical protein AMXMBFR57_13290 [Acidimicrobiia bacterium]